MKRRKRSLIQESDYLGEGREGQIVPVSSSDAALSPSELASRPLSLSEYVANHGLAVERATQPTPADAPFFRLARQLARKLPALRPTLAVLRRILSRLAVQYVGRHPFTHEEIQAAQWLSAQLRPYGVHIDVKEESHGVSLRCRVPRVGLIRQFLTGLWLEFYAYEVVLHAVHNAALPGEVYRSVVITYPGCSVHIGELDVVAIWGRAILVLEAKTSGGRPRSFRLLKKLLGVPPRCAILVRTGFRGVESCRGFVRCGVAALEGYVRELFRKEASAAGSRPRLQLEHTLVHHA